MASARSPSSQQNIIGQLLELSGSGNGNTRATGSASAATLPSSSPESMLAASRRYLKAHSDGHKFAVNLHAAVADFGGAENYNFFYFLPHCTCLSQPHADSQ